MTDSDYRNWRRRRFQPALDRANVDRCVPYDLRHSFASLMIQAGYSAAELAAEMGHAPTLTLDTYVHLFSEFARGERVDADAAIGAAREGDRDAIGTGQSRADGSSECVASNSRSA